MVMQTFTLIKRPKSHWLHNVSIRYSTPLLLIYHLSGGWFRTRAILACSGKQREEVLHVTLSVTIFNTNFVDRENSNASMNIVG